VNISSERSFLEWALMCVAGLFAMASNASDEKIEVISQGWHLAGDLQIPESDQPVPAVLMLNQAAGDRSVYRELANRLEARGIASLALDLRGHGQSINLGQFVPGEVPRSPLIWDAEEDVIAAHDFLRQDKRIDSQRIGVVGASYSGEEMAEAGRLNGYAKAYVALSPGSFSPASIAGLDESQVPWLFVVSRNERFLREITADVREQSQTVELLVVPGEQHASDILDGRRDLAERIAAWLSYRLN
jgi:dienelactone hydrolase